MRRYAVLLLFLSAGSGALSAASAQPVRGLYFSAGGGVSIPQDERVRSGHEAAPVAASPAPTGQASLGYGFGSGGFGSGLRLELEGLGRGSAQGSLEHRP